MRDTSSLSEADWLAVAVGNGVMVAVLVMELLRELLGESVPLNENPESVRVLVLVNVRERVLEISSVMDCD